jgi:hypothetical protein
MYKNCHAETCDQKDRSRSANGSADHVTLPSQEDVQDEIVTIARSLLKGTAPTASVSEPVQSGKKADAVKGILNKLPGLSW